MHFDSHAVVTRIEQAIPRPGFEVRFHRVWFRLTCDGLPEIDVPVWMHPAFPEEQVEAVARCFLAGRLRDMATAAGKGAMSPHDVDKLWRSVNPAGNLIVD